MTASDVGSDVRLPQVDALQGTGQEPGDEEEMGGTMTLIEHLEELRHRMFIVLGAIVVGTIVSFVFWNQILQFLLTPLPAISLPLVHQSQKLVQHEVGEAFMIALKLSLAAGIALASPVLLYQVWRFISPGLTKRERKYAAPFTVLGAVLFVAGLAVGFLVLRYPITWLIDFGNHDFTLLLDADSYFTFVAYFLLAFGIVFELPLVLSFLAAVGIVNSRLLRQKRMYILFGLWVLSCFITPGADPYSPVIIGASLTILFELSILLMRLMKR